MSIHHKVVCSCGAVIMQCRCIGHEKALEIRQDGCAQCIARHRIDLRQPPLARTKGSE